MTQMQIFQMQGAHLRQRGEDAKSLDHVVNLLMETHFLLQPMSPSPLPHSQQQVAQSATIANQPLASHLFSQLVTPLFVVILGFALITLRKRW